MQREFPITGLTVEMREAADGQVYQFGVNVDGVFIALWAAKTGGINDDFARAAEQKAIDAAKTPAPPAEAPAADAQPPVAG